VSELAVLLPLALATLRLATPLVIAAMGELVSERAGVLNIGVEGMMLAGAFGAVAAGAATGSATIAVLASLAAGVSMAAVFAFFVLARGADPIVCGAAINLWALGATGSASRLLLPSGAGGAVGVRVAEWAPGLHPFTVVAVGLVVAAAVGLDRTRAGLALRAVGERALAAHVQGLPVLRIRWAATLAGGACAGLAGASLVLWLSDVFVEGMTSGRGFIALALVLFGGYRPARIAMGALLFGAASALQFRLQATGVTIPYNLLLMTPYVLTLAVLAIFAGRARVPGDLARPFRPRD
jgi:ABC-type uncharacterized transport system permease subunit